MEEKVQILNAKKTSLAAATPQYLPEIAWFLRMAQADQFVLADDLCFNHPSSVNRAAIKSVDGKQWLTIPIATTNSENRVIREVRIDNSGNWRRKHWRTLQVNYAYAAYFDYFADFFDHIYRQKWDFLIDLNMTILDHLREALRITTPLLKTSVLELPGEVKAKTLALLKATNSTVYLTDATTAKFLRSPLFLKADIDIRTISLTDFRYRQQFGTFLENLSVVDLLFNEGPEAIWLLASQFSIALKNQK